MALKGTILEPVWFVLKYRYLKREVIYHTTRNESTKCFRQFFRHLKNTILCKDVFLCSLFSWKFDDQLSPNFHRFAIFAYVLINQVRILVVDNCQKYSPQYQICTSLWQAKPISQPQNRSNCFGTGLYLTFSPWKAIPRSFSSKIVTVILLTQIQCSQVPESLTCGSCAQDSRHWTLLVITQNKNC